MPKTALSFVLRTKGWKKLVCILMTTAMVACKSGNGQHRVAGFDIDSVVVDTLVALDGKKDAPACELSLHLCYLKGDEQAQRLNDTLLRAGILMPDYFSLNKEKLSVKELVDSFARRFTAEYLAEYGPLYRADKEHADAYRVQYRVKTQFEEKDDGIITNTANIYSYGGGAYGINQTIVLNIDTKSGKIVRLADILSEDGEEQAKNMVVEKLAKQFDVKTLEELQEKGIFANADVYLPENFILSRKTVTLIYGEDEIAPHAMGEIRVEMNRGELK